MSLKHIFALIILALWFVLQTGMQWDEGRRDIVNVVYSILTFLILMAVYWTPFWLIFLK